MADFQHPLSTQGYLALLASIVENNQAALLMLEGVGTLDNLPAGAKRWNASSNYWERWSGSAWAALSVLYEIKVRDSDRLNDQAAAFYRDAGNLNAGTLAGARFADSSHGSRGGASLHALASASAHGFMSSTFYSKLLAIEENATADMSAGEILTALLSVDGPGTGLNADLLDGLHASNLLSRENHTGSQSYSTISGLGSLAVLSAITAAHLPAVIAGTVYLATLASLSTVVTYSTAFVKIKSIYVPVGGTVRTSFFLRAALEYGSGVSSVAQARIYVNDIAVGSLRSQDESGSTYVEDISIPAESYVQIYARTTSGPIDCDVSQFKIGVAAPGVLMGELV